MSVEFCGCTLAAERTNSKCGRVNPKVTFELDWRNRTNAVQFQDALYGKGNRVHNIMVKDRKVIGKRCTVCGHVGNA